jgi:DNA mismatch repair protein MutS
MFATHEGQVTDSDSALTLVKDLELFVGQGSNKQVNILEKTKNTATICGEATYAHMLANPLTDAAQLTKRQEMVQELLSNEKLFNTIEQILQRAHGAENNFFSFWREEQATKEFIEKRLFFNKEFLKKFNTSPAVMEAVTRLDNLGTTWLLTSPLVMYTAYKYVEGKYIAPRLGISNEQRVALGLPVMPEGPYNLKHAIGAMCEGVKYWINPYSYSNMYNDTNNLFLRSGSTRESAKNWALGLTGINAGAILLVAATHTYSSKKAINEAQTTNKAIKYLHTQLIDVATLVDCCKELDHIMSVDPTIAAGLEHKQALATLRASEDAEFNSLVQLLQTDTFKGEARFFALSGRVLAAHQLMKSHKQQFAAACQALGEIDAAMSIAKLYKKSAHNRVNYNFATYTAADKPVMRLTGFWHPLVALDKVVTNDLALGGNAPSKDAVVTGSNTGGKSTMLKSILLTVLCAQTMTIVPAQQAVLTPFYYLGCYLHVADDIAAGNSLFKAEVLRAQALIENAQKLMHGQFGFVVIDELFTGTAADKGAQAAYKVAEYLTTVPSMTFILATHFPELTELEKKTQGACKNYMVDVIKKEDGTIVRPFKLEPGVSSTSIANDILQEEMNDINFFAL